ncbi:DUF1917 domain-containing protein [Aspergillus lucknowensis]|uniref:DUF1917-domain-containing protein n=1 Tax=Aspergillus lucknowensis TaxID=176173 RepID=A0ABR4LR28_9EURO
MADLKPDDILSDDSSFYGDEEETTRLERRASRFDPEPYWTTVHPHLLSTIQNMEQQRNKQPTGKEMSPILMEVDIPPRLPRNKPGQGESSSAFLARLPPSTTRAETVGPWIYIHTRYASELKDDVPGLERKGREALDAYENQEARLRYENDREGGSKIALSRKLAPLQRELEQHLFSLARDTNTVTGKWMMFISDDCVDSYWRPVADATMRGQLGIAAKVATNDGQGRSRLIAVYTRDYEDRQDIKRVLRRLVELGLVKKGERPIYYKCDVLTYLDIMSKNKYGLKPTLFSSADVLAGKV